MENLVEYFKKQKYIRLAYLFGSVAKGKTGKLSDIDIGVYLDESLNDDERFKIRLKLISDLSLILKTNKVDVIIMNSSPLLLNYNIIKNGKILKSEELYRLKIEHRILSNYLDMRYHIKRHTAEAIKRISKSGLL